MKISHTGREVYEVRTAQRLPASAAFCPCPKTAAAEGIGARMLTQINTADRDKRGPNEPKVCVQAFAARLCSLASLCFSGERLLEEKPWPVYAGACRQLPPPGSLCLPNPGWEQPRGGTAPGQTLSNCQLWPCGKRSCGTGTVPGRMAGWHRFHQFRAISGANLIAIRQCNKCILGASEQRGRLDVPWNRHGRVVSAPSMT